MKTSIDLVVLTYNDEKLKTLLIKRDDEPFKNDWAVPGYLIAENEDLNESINSKLKSYFGYIPHYKQMEVFGNPDRHPDGHVITICFYVLINIENSKINLPYEYKWVDIKKIPQLAFDHNELIAHTVIKIEKYIKRSPIAFHLLPKYFKLSELHELYSKILNKEYDKRNFIRKLKLMNIVEKSGISEIKVKHRPAELYVYNSELYKKFLELDEDFKLP